MQDLQKSKYDAIPVWTFNHPVAFALMGFNVRQFPSRNYGFNCYGAVFFAKPNVISRRRDELVKFLAVTQRGWVEAYRKPDETVRLVMDKWFPRSQWIRNDKALTEKQQALQMKISKRYLFEGVGVEQFGAMTEFQWSSSLRMAKRFGIVSNPHVKSSDFYTMEVLDFLKTSRLKQ
jgi:hypothetical protein